MSKFKLPFTVAEQSEGISAAIHMNAMSTSQAKAPYLYTPVMTAYLDQNTMDEKTVATLGGDANVANARYFVTAVVSAIADLMAEGDAKVDCGWFTAAPAVSGSAQFANSQPTAANEVYIDLQPSKNLRDLVAKIPYADSAANTQFTVRTITEPLPSGKAPLPGYVTAGNTAYINGSNLTPDLRAVFVNNETLEETEATVTKVISTLAVITVPLGLAEGVYSLDVTCRGIGTTPVTARALNNVQVAGCTTTTVTRIKAENQESDNVVGFLDTTHDVVIHGCALGEITANDMYVVMEDAEGTQLDKQRIDTSAFTASASALTFTNGLNPINRNVPDGDYLDNKAFILIEKNGNVVKFEFDYV